MAVRAVPFEGQNDANEEDWYRLHRETGVVEGLNLTLTGLAWSLSPGAAYSSGAMILNEDTPLTGSSEPTTGGSPRRDMLVARRVLVPGGGSYGEIALKQGTAGSSPADPAVTQELLGTWEEPLFSWQVAANGAASTSGVLDLRQGVGAGPSIRGSFRRTNGDDRLNANAVTDLDARVSVTSRGVGWTVYNPGNCIGWSNPRHGKYLIEAHLLTGGPGGRWESLLLNMPGGAVVPIDDDGPASAFGGLSGSYTVWAPNGISFGFRYQTNAGSAGTIRVPSRWACTWLGPI